MSDNRKDLGKLISIYPPSAIQMQRATFVAVLSFVFFLAMMVAFYTLQTLVYFLLASAFLIVYLVTMFGLFSQRRNALKIFEHGFSYRKFTGRWDEIESVQPTKPHTFEIRKTGGETTILSSSVEHVDQAAERIRSLADAHC